MRFEKLREFRLLTGLKQEEVAEKLGLTQKGYSKLELGVVELKAQQILTLCDLYDCSADELLGRF